MGKPLDYRFLRFTANGAGAYTFAVSEFLKAVNVAVQGENITVETEIIKNLDAPYNGQSNVPVS